MRYLFKSKSLTFLAIAAFLVGGFFIFTGQASAADLNVGPDKAYTTIQSAITDASDGDTINVAAGTYAEKVLIDGKTNLTIKGSGQGKDNGPLTLIEPATETHSAGITIKNSNGLTIKDLTIHTAGNEMEGIWVHGFAFGADAITGLTIHNTTITVDGGAGADEHAAGIVGDASASGLHSGWNITGNTITSDGVAISIQDVSASTISGNTLTVQTAGTNVLWTSERHNLAGLVFSDNTVSGSGGVQVLFVTDYNQVNSNVNVEDPIAETTITGLTIHGNKFSNWDTRAIKIGDQNNSGATETVTNISITDNTFNDDHSVSQIFANMATTIIGGLDAPSATGSGNTFNVSGTAKIQTAIDASFAGDIINVYPGTYNQDEANNYDSVTGLSGANNFNIFVNKSVTIQGVNASGVPITNYNDVQAHVSNKRALPTFGTDTIFVQADNVTISGLEISGSVVKTIEVTGNNVTIKNSKINGDASGVAGIYFDDSHYIANANTSLLQSYRIEGNLIDGGGSSNGLRFSSGAGWSGAVSGRVITNNKIQNVRDGIEFVGPQADPWDMYPVGAATITSNNLTATRRQVTAWGQYNPGSGMVFGYGALDWNAILTSNTFDKAVTVLTPTNDMRTWDMAYGSTGGIINIIGIYSDSSAIQTAISKAQAGDTINVAAGTYYEKNILINKSLTIVGDPGDASAGPGVNAPVIDGGSVYGDAFLIDNGVSNVTVEGFEIRNYKTDDFDGVGNAISAWVGSTSNITVRDNYFHDLGYNGVLVGNDKSSNPSKWGDHTGWTIKNNVIENFGYIGFELTNTSNSSIEDNIFHLNTPYIGAIFSSARRSETNLTFKNNQIDGSPSTAFPVIYAYAYDLDMVSPILDSVLIEGNSISTVGTPAQIYVRNIGTGTVTNVHVHKNTLSSLKTNTPITIDATDNWWGTASSTEITAKISGAVSSTPWYINSGMTVLSDAFVGDTITASTGNFDLQETTLGSGEAGLPTGATQITLSDTSVLDLSSATTSMTLTPVTIGGNTVDLTQSVTLQSGINGEDIVLTNSNPDVAGITASIPDGTIISGPAGWDGTIAPPTATTSIGTAPTGFSVGNNVISVGSPDVTLVFSNPVTLLLAGVTGTVGYKPAGSDVWTKITNSCGTNFASPNNPPANSECSISDGTNTKILTYHFTSFGEMIPDQTPPPSTSSSGGYVQTACSNVVYSEWGSVFNGLQYRTVLSQTPSSCSLSASQIAAESRPYVASVEPVNSQITPVSETPQTSTPIQQVLGVKVYADGTLLKGTNNKIYVVKGNALQYISSLKELAKYKGAILRVTDETIASFAKTAVLGEKKYADGTLLRGTDNRIYVLIGGKLQYIPTLKELAKYKRAVLRVTDETIASFAKTAVLGVKKYADGTLIKAKGDVKIYVIKDGKKVHIKSLAELKQYKGQTLTIEASELNNY